jgi:uncharacterized protein
MITHAYLLHGWGGTPTGAWKSWLKGELEKMGVRVVCPQLPNADVPRVEEWVQFLQKLITSAPEQTLIVAHSLSAPAVLMFLERQPDTARFAQVIFVGGVYRDIDTLDAAGEEIARPWLTHMYDAAQIRAVAPCIDAFFSDDDVLIPLSTATDMQRDFGVVPHIEHGMGHYNGQEYSQILEAVNF